MNRETGRILRGVQRGSSSFVSILNLVMFQTLPVLVKLVLVAITISLLYDWVFLLIIFSFMVTYIVAQVSITEWRSKFQKDKSQKDSGYNQKAIDSLLNFETVKYFNAEDHERNRFEKSLVLYK